MTLYYIGGSYARGQRNQQAFCRYQYVIYGLKILTYIYFTDKENAVVLCTEMFSYFNSV